MNKLISALSTETKQIEIKNTINCVMDGLDDFDKWVEALSSEELRAKSIERGRVFAWGFHPQTPGGCAQLG